MRYIFAGILVDFALIAVAFLYMLVRAVLSFNGTCSAPLSLDTFSRTCTLYEAALVEPLFLLVFMMLTFRWFVVPLAIIPPLVGGVLGARKSKGFT